MSADAFDVAVVVPVRNGAAYLAEALASVAAQTVPAREVVVVDDGSTDGSAAVARAAGPGVRVVEQAPLGAGAARNRGVAETTAPWLAFLDADDRWLPRKLARQREALGATPGAVAAIGSIRQFFSPELGRTDAPDPEIVVGTSPTALVVHRDAFARTGGFPTDPGVPEAAFWWVRFEATGAVLLTLDEVLAERRLHRTNTGLLRPGFRQGYLRLAKEALDRRRRGGPA
ncbi:MAG: glycosyltransferase family A protein [Planctomycetota bacterium]